MNEKIPIRDQKVILLGEKYNTKAAIEARLVEMDEHKAIRDQEWADTQAEHDKAQFIIEQAKQVIVSAMSSSFLQKGRQIPATAFAQLTSHFHEAHKIVFKRKSFSSIFKVLATITAAAPVQADKSGVDRIIELCDKLLQKIAESREIERRDYQHWVKSYEEQK